MQTDTNWINKCWDSTKRRETLYFYYGPSSQNENERKSKQGKTIRIDKSKKKHTNAYLYGYINAPTDTQHM